MTPETVAVDGDERQPLKPYVERTPQDYLDAMEPDLRAKLSDAQRQEMLRLLDLAIPKPAPKIVDLRFAVDLLLERFHVVVVVGKDRRRRPRAHRVSRLTRAANWLVGIGLLLGLNLLLSVALFLVAYLIKSALGIDLLPGHFGSR